MKCKIIENVSVVAVGAQCSNINMDKNAMSFSGPMMEVFFLLLGWVLRAVMRHRAWRGIRLSYTQGIVGCTPTNVPLWEIPIYKPYISLYSGCLWVIIPKNPYISPISTMGTLLGVHPIVP